MRYELSDYGWTAIKPMLPNKPHGVRRVNDRRVLNGILFRLNLNQNGAMTSDDTLCTLLHNGSQWETNRAHRF
jgi:hypothetical protein